MPSQSTHSLTKNQKKKLKKKKRKAAVRAGTSEASQDTDSPVAHSSGPADSSTTEQSGNLQGDGAQSDGQAADSYNGRCEMPHLGTRVKHNLKAGARGPALCQHMHCRLALSVRGMIFSSLRLAACSFAISRTALHTHATRWPHAGAHCPAPPLLGTLYVQIARSIVALLLWAVPLLGLYEQQQPEPLEAA